ncbi:hypothetical protein MRX96_046812 [Rhipicephalus microplus]
MAPPRKSNVETETSVTVRSRTTRSRSASKSPKTKRVTSRSRSRSASRAAVTSPRTPRSPQKKAATPKSPSPAKKAKSPAKKSPAPKSPARLPKTARPKSPGRPKSPAPKSPARKSPAAKSPARKTPAKTRAPSKSPARTTTQRKRSVSPAREKGDDSLRVGPSRIPVSSSSSSSSLEITEKPPVLSRASLSTPLGASASQPVVSLTTNSITRRVVSSPVAGVSPHAVRSSPRIATMHATSLEDEEEGPSTSKQGLVNIVEPRARFRVHMPQWRLPFRLGMTLSSLFWFFLVPSLAFVLYLLCQKESCTIMKAPRVPRTLDAYFHWKLFIGYPAFLLIQALLQALPIGRTVQGFPSKALKHRISYDYRINGYVNLLVTAAVFGGLAWYGFPVAIPYRHIFQLLVTAATFAPVLALFLYVKGRYSTWEHQFPPGNTGNVLNDYVKGKELSPRIGRTFDLAAWCFRCGLLTWATLLGAMAWHEFKAKGCLEYGFAVSAACQEYYLSSAFVNEDGLGYVAVASFLVLMPFVSALPAKFLLEHQPKTLPIVCYAGIVILFLVGLTAMHLAHKRKYHLRRNWPDPSSRGPGLDYLLDNAGNRLAVSGLWGSVRHPNYLADLACHLAFALPCGFHHVLPFYSVLLSTLFLVMRTIDVERKCRQRYGDLWASYTHRVKYRLVPYVF